MTHLSIKSFILRTTVVSAVFACIPSLSLAAAPRTIPFQGVATNSAGQPLADGPRNATFRLYATASGGAALWTESQTVYVAGGRFSASLGAITPFPESLLFDVPYFTGVSLAGDPEMSPRLPLQSVPYALSLALPSRANTASNWSGLTIINDGNGRGISAYRTSTSGTEPAVLGSTASTAPYGVGVLGEVSSTTSGFLSAGVLGVNRDSDGSGVGVYGSHASSGWGVYGNAPLGYGVYGNSSSGVGVAGYSFSGNGLLAATSTGIAGQLSVTDASATTNALVVSQAGLGDGIFVRLTNTSGAGIGVKVDAFGAGAGVMATSSGGTGLWGITTDSYSAGVIGDNTTGEAVVGRTAGGAGVGAVVGRNDGAGPGVRGFNAKSGPGGLFQTQNPSNGTNAGNGVQVEVNGSGNGIDVNYKGGGASTTTTRNLARFATSGVNKARIDNSGKGFFNGGTQSSGADLAEAFAVHGSPTDYEPGDVLVISTRTDRALEKSATPNATSVAGVYSTRPGTLLSERDTDADHSDMVPLGVIGVIPTKVTTENGPIRRGDLLVTSSTAGHAMKAGPNPPAGSVIGKALAEFDGEGVGLIRVLVNVR